ncbi:hypothetical protein BE20_05785 [Sorangium cellulosum]|nr:hypothetical protein BE20_05785 [Sorangium cellulosum]
MGSACSSRAAATRVALRARRASRSARAACWSARTARYDTVTANAVSAAITPVVSRRRRRRARSQWATTARR